MIRGIFLVACVALVPVRVIAADGDEPAARPGVRQMRPVPLGARPPSPRELVDAREALERRFGEPLGRADTAAGATAATAALLEAAPTEEDRALKWLMLAEARRLAVATGDAAAVDRAVVMADAVFEFDAVAEEQRLLRDIPLRALDRGRAAALATVAEELAQRAEADGRHDEAADAWSLAIRGWQRAGDVAAARRAAKRLGEAEERVLRGRPFSGAAGSSARGSDTSTRGPSGGSAR